MKSGAQLVLGLAVGYFLGRNRRMRFAIMICAAAATGGIGGAGRQLARSGTKLIASSDLASEISPALGEISDIIRGEVLDVARNAALEAVGSRIDSLSDNLHSRAETLRHPEEFAEDVSTRAEDMGKRIGLGGQEPEEDEEHGLESEEEASDESPAPRRSAATTGIHRARR